MIRYQQAIRAAVDVPVLLSPLLLIPFLEQMLPHDRALGIITAKGSSLTPEVLKAAGVPAGSDRLVIAGLEGAPYFAAAFLTYSGDLDAGTVEKETLMPQSLSSTIAPTSACCFSNVQSCRHMRLRSSELRVFRSSTLPRWSSLSSAA